MFKKTYVKLFGVVNDLIMTLHSATSTKKK